MKDASDYGASFSESNKFFKLVVGETVAKDKAGAAATEAAKSVTLRAEKSACVVLMTFTRRTLTFPATHASTFRARKTRFPP
ncbi:unnamed protein product, partial [Ectocarpus sp. 12 AP-2014]